MTPARRRPGAALLLGLAAAIVLVLQGGCDTPEATEAVRHAELLDAGEDATAAAAGLFHADVAFHRRYSDGKWRRDRDLVFTIKDRSHVRARVALQNVRPERTYSVHLVWLRPDGRELFRRYAEVTRNLVSLPAGVAPDSTGALPERYLRGLHRRFGEKRGTRIAARLAAAPAGTVTVNTRRYKDAVDLADEDLLVRLEEDPELRVYSRLNISREKQREPGAYRLQVYLDRKLLQEIPFEVRENT